MGRRKDGSKKTVALFSVRLNAEDYKKVQSLFHDTQKNLNADYIPDPHSKTEYITKSDIIGSALVIGLKQILSRGSLK